MDKEIVVYIHNKILFIHKKEWNLAICDDMDEPQKHYAKSNKSEKDKYHRISLISGI